MGRPVKWTVPKIDELADKMDIYFKDHLNQYKTDKEYKEIPFIEAFCRDVGNVYYDYLGDLAKKSEKLSLALKRAKFVQKEILVKGALSSRFNNIFSIFTAKNITDMRDQIDNNLTLINKDVTDIQIQHLDSGGKLIREAKVVDKPKKLKP